MSDLSKCCCHNLLHDRNVASCLGISSHPPSDFPAPLI